MKLNLSVIRQGIADHHVLTTSKLSNASRRSVAELLQFATAVEQRAIKAEAEYAALKAAVEAFAEPRTVSERRDPETALGRTHTVREFLAALGVKYASHQRAVHFRVDAPVFIDHWTFADHRHPVEGCQVCAESVRAQLAAEPASSPVQPTDEEQR